MTIKPVNLITEPHKNGQQNSKVSFEGVGNPIVTVMESVDRGGYIASFVVQDGCGFVAPRIITGLNRNREETHEYNWKFAATEAIRELLSGPSMVAIPAAILFFVKRKFGTANDVPVKFLNAFGDDFSKFVSNQDITTLKDKNVLKQNYYQEVMKNILSSATNGGLKGKELDDKAKYFTQKIFDVESAPKKPGWKKFVNTRVEGSSYDMLCDLTDEFVALSKKYRGPLEDPQTFKFVTYAKDSKKIETGSSFKSFLNHLRNFSGDAIDSVTTKFKGATNKEVVEFVDKFKHSRVASRFMLILGMDLAVAAFLSIVPKLYKHKDGNPGLVGLKVADAGTPSTEEKKEVE